VLCVYRFVQMNCMRFKNEANNVFEFLGKKIEAANLKFNKTQEKRKANMVDTKTKARTKRTIPTTKINSQMTPRKRRKLCQPDTVNNKENMDKEPEEEHGIHEEVHEEEGRFIKFNITTESWKDKYGEGKKQKKEYTNYLMNQLHRFFTRKHCSYMTYPSTLLTRANCV